MIILTALRDGQPAGRTEAEEGRVLRIGRAATNDLVLNGAAVSDEHCQISHDGKSWRVIDTGGRADVFVSGEQVAASRSLSDGESLEVADFRILVRITTPNQTPQPSDHTEYRVRPTFVGEGQNAVEILAGPGQGTIRRFGARLLIGRASRCDLVIDDATVSREHLLLESRGGQWMAVSRSPKNVTLKNNLPIHSAQVVTGDILTIGPSRLRLALLAKPTTRLVVPESLMRLVGNKKLLLGAAIGLFVLALALFFLSKPAKTPQQAVVESEWGKQRAMQDAEFMRKVSTLLIQARRLYEEGQDEQALTRLTALLELDAGNEEARRLVASIQSRTEAKAATAKQRQEQSAQARAKALPFVREAERLLSAGDTAAAKASVGQALALDADLADAQALLARIEAKDQADRRQAEERTKATAAMREQLRAVYAEAEADLAANAPYKALVVYRRLAEEETDPVRAAAARKKAAEIQDVLVKRIMPDYALGQKLYGQKKYAEAFKVWVKVLDVYPEAKETRAKVAELTPSLEAEAKRLYEEGLVHEGLGNRETAMARWRAVLEAMPLTDNEYYRRAAAKLGLSPDGGERP
ncbi:MAG: FHA domain-containing protein [Solidesulfovibrio sp.]